MLCGFIYIYFSMYTNYYRACLFLSYQMILDDFLLWYQMLPSIISTARVMLYCVFVYIVSGCSCVDFHLQLELEVWRQVEDPSNPGKFYYYNQAWQQKKHGWRIEEFDDSPRDNFRRPPVRQLGKFLPSLQRWDTELWWYFWLLFFFSLDKKTLEFRGNYKMFAQIWIRWLDAKKWFSGFI